MAGEPVERDVVVVGAGMGGLVAAVRAAERGATVTVLEKGPRAGGSMYLSHGYVWTYDSLERAREAIPHGNPELQELVVDSIDEGLEWLDDLGVRLKEMDIDLPTGMKMEPPEFIETMTGVLEDAGGEVRLRTPMKRLLTDDGRVTGVVAATEDGEEVRFDADGVVLATGGFQGNERLVEQYITDHPENLWLRGNPWSTGDGLLAAQGVGAKTTLGLGTFYGHNLLAPPAEFSPIEFGQATQYYGVHAVALDESGRRYTDEAESMLEESLTQDTAKKAGGRAWYVVDRDLFETDIREGRVGGIVKQARDDFGGEVLEADSLEALGEALEDAGTDGNRAVETIRTFNEAMERGEGEALEPPRTGNERTIDTPPFYAVRVQPGITTTCGGLDVTGDMAVLHRASTSSGVDQYPETMRDVFFTPIPGLFAAGMDVGNVNHRQYMGGLSVSLVTGRIAGESAAEFSLQ